MIRLLGPTAKKVYTVTPDSPRALDGEILRDEFRAAGVDSELLTDKDQDHNLALHMIIDESESDDVIVICGTLTITGEMIRCLS